MRIKVLSSAAIILLGAILAAGKVAATTPPPLVTASETPPLSCSTPNGFNVTAWAGAGPATTQFPVPVACPVGGGSCFLYEYRITSASAIINYTMLTVSATQSVNSTVPASIIIQPAYGSESDFLEGALHEYALKTNHSSTSVSVSAYIKPTVLGEISRARVGTVQVKGGTKKEACLIATPGVRSGDVFQPVFKEQQVVVAGGKCTAILVFDASGSVIDVTAAAPIPPYAGNCNVQTFPGGLFVDGQPLQNNSGPHGITTGTGTRTCYGPPRPSIPKCVCSDLAC
jgi:hypothetical protein